MRRIVARVTSSQAGFSLVELVVVIAISGVIAAIIGVFLLRPIQGYDAQTKRAELVDAAESALRRIARDIRRALPNSVRIDGTGKIIEMLNTIDGGRYREGPGQVLGGTNYSGTQFRLDFNAADTDGFNIEGCFRNLTFVGAPATFTATTHRLAIYNQGVAGADAYTDAATGAVPGVITAAGLFTIQDNNCSAAADGEHRIIPNGGSSFRFRWRSPNQRVFIVDTPITYLCDDAAQRSIRRYTGYSITAAQPTNPTAAPLNAVIPALVTNHVSGCVFTYQAGVAQRSAVVTLDMTVRDTTTNEQVRLLHQVHVDNAP